jgi:hypothetical protein
MRAVRADGELELKQQLVGGDALGVLRTAELTAQLTELARSDAALSSARSDRSKRRPANQRRPNW